MSNQMIGFFTIVGETNVGKSTIINRLVGQKISIVTHKVQTTRFNVMGVYTDGEAQIVLTDTPGLFHSRTGEGSAILNETWDGIYSSDNIILVVDISRKSFEKSFEILDKVNRKDVILVFNKIDKVKKSIIPGLIGMFSKRFGITDIFMISATKNNGVQDLRDFLLSRCTSGEWAFDPSEKTDSSLAKFAAEITREKIYELLHEEIPYSCEVHTTRIEGDNIYQTIYVNKESHKPILIGKGGNKIRSIGIASRIELSRIFRRDYNIFLNVALMVKQ